MKRRIILASIITIVLVILSTSLILSRYNDDKGELAGQYDYTYQKIASEALDKDTKLWASGSWQNAKVENVTMDKENDFGIFPLDNSSGIINIKGKEVVVVTFDTGNKIHGDVIVFIDARTKKAIGIAPFM